MTSEPTPIITDDDRMISATTSGLLNLRGATVDQLADTTGITRATLYRKLRHGRWSANEAGAIARAFAVDVSDLFAGRVTPGPDLSVTVKYSTPRLRLVA